MPEYTHLQEFYNYIAYLNENGEVEFARIIDYDLKDEKPVYCRC